MQWIIMSLLKLTGDIKLDAALWYLGNMLLLVVIKCKYLKEIYNVTYNRILYSFGCRCQKQRREWRANVMDGALGTTLGTTWCMDHDIWFCCFHFVLLHSNQVRNIKCILQGNTIQYENCSFMGPCQTTKASAHISTHTRSHDNTCIH